jgi:DNA integrity scanning protein DisA with diadenylate cyclase activity
MPKPYKEKTRTKNAKANAGHVSARARELLASIEATLIQNHAQLAQSIARIAPILVLKSTQYKAFINSVTTSYEYKRKNIPSILLTMLAQSSTVLQRVNHLLRFHNEARFLQAELGRLGLNAISAFIELTLTSMEELEETMRDYTQNALADLFKTTKQNISQHIKNIFEDGELHPNSVVKDFLTTSLTNKSLRLQ